MGNHLNVHLEISPPFASVMQCAEMICCAPCSCGSVQERTTLHNSRGEILPLQNGNIATDSNGARTSSEISVSSAESSLALASQCLGHANTAKSAAFRGIKQLHLLQKLMGAGDVHQISKNQAMITLWDTEDKKSKA